MLGAVSSRCALHSILNGQKGATSTPMTSTINSLQPSQIQNFAISKNFIGPIIDRLSRSHYSHFLNASGRFGLPPTRVEAMYAPETFGETPNAVLEVGP